MTTRAPVLLHELVEVRDIDVDDLDITGEAFETLATLTAFVDEPRLLVMPEQSVPGVAAWR